MECNGEGKEMEWKRWVNNDFVKWIWKSNAMEMETRWKELQPEYGISMEWNGIFGGISPRGEWKRNGKKLNFQMELEWNGSGMEWKWNNNGICN